MTGTSHPRHLLQFMRALRSGVRARGKSIAATASNHAFASHLYRAILRRAATDAELAGVVATLESGADRGSLFETFVASEEYQRVVDSQTPVFVPPGHYYSPIVDPGSLGKKSREVIASRRDNILGIELDLPGQKRLFDELSRSFPLIPFRAHARHPYRYYYENPFFSYGDAIILFAMIDNLKPARIVEIGSGFSSACILDTLEVCGLRETRFALIDPDLERARGLLGLRSELTVDVHERRLQEVPLSVFEELGNRDILFIDSTHVAKTGSDVLFEVFEILPRLAPGVLIHFHDCFYPFEYPADWVFEENRSWNELYLLRAFLMYNRDFRIAFFSDQFLKSERDLVSSRMPDILKNTGGSLWVEKLAGRPPERSRVTEDTRQG